MTRCYLQEYPENSINAVRKRLFFASVCALQVLSRNAPYHNLGAALSTSLLSEFVALWRPERVSLKFGLRSPRRPLVATQSDVRVLEHFCPPMCDICGLY
jgi:hypothetical protein